MKTPIHAPGSVDERLKAEAPEVKSPNDLHGSIMSAVRESRNVEARPAPTTIRFGPAFALGALMLAAVVAEVQPNQPRRTTSSAQPMASASQALYAGGEYACSMPSVAISPVTAEWQRVHADVAQTARFLLASIP